MTEFEPFKHRELADVQLADAKFAPVRLAECAFGGSCDNLGEGHALSFMQRRLASATASKWRDAIVSEVTDDGFVSLTTVDEGAAIVVWHHADTTALLQAGDPVAVHSVYHVLAVGSTWLNVADTAS